MSEPQISLIIPAYQEERRIGETVSVYVSYLDLHYPGSELILVCDGCTDGTATVAKQSFKAKRVELLIMKLSTNQGKGYAVRQGVLSASRQYVFFTDADLSFEPQTIEHFLHCLKDGADVAIAQRKKDVVYPEIGRRLLASFSRFLIGNIVLPGIRDSQAGFKGFRKDASKFLFSRARINRFLFDLEILIMAKDHGFKISKVYTTWQDKPGSTVRLYVDTARALRDLGLILWLKVTGAYR